MALWPKALTIGLAVMAASGWADDQTSSPTTVAPPAGVYLLDPAHARLIFNVNHLGFSDYTALFLKFEATLNFDPDAPETMTVEAKVDPASIETFYRDAKVDLNAVVAGPDFLDAKQFPQMSFQSTKVRATGPDAAAVSGNLTLHGVTRQVTLRVRYNGGYAGHPLDPGGARVGFSVDGALYRSDFGMESGLPLPGTTFGVGDLVAFHIEAEMINSAASGVEVGP